MMVGRHARSRTSAKPHLLAKDMRANQLQPIGPRCYIMHDSYKYAYILSIHY